MCFQDFIGYICGHCSLPVCRPCPLTTQDHQNPVCTTQAIRPYISEHFCPVCSRMMHSRAVLIQEWEHQFLHDRGACGCEVIFPDVVRPRVIEPSGSSYLADDEAEKGQAGKAGKGKATKGKGKGKDFAAQKKIGGLDNVQNQEEPQKKPQKAPPIFREVVDGEGKVGFAIRLPSLYCAEYIADHRPLHERGECSCHADFTSYKPEWAADADADAKGAGGDTHHHHAEQPPKCQDVSQPQQHQHPQAHATPKIEYRTPISTSPDSKSPLYRRSQSVDLPRSILATCMEEPDWEPDWSSPESNSRSTPRRASFHELPPSHLLQSNNTNLAALTWADHPGEGSGDNHEPAGHGGFLGNGEDRLGQQHQALVRHVTFADDASNITTAAASGAGISEDGGSSSYYGPHNNVGPHVGFDAGHGIGSGPLALSGAASRDMPDPTVEHRDPFVGQNNTFPWGPPVQYPAAPFEMAMSRAPMPAISADGSISVDVVQQGQYHPFEQLYGQQPSIQQQESQQQQGHQQQNQQFAQQQNQQFPRQQNRQFPHQQPAPISRQHQQQHVHQQIPPQQITLQQFNTSSQLTSPQQPPRRRQQHQKNHQLQPQPPTEAMQTMSFAQQQHLQQAVVPPPLPEEVQALTNLPPLRYPYGPVPAYALHATQFAGFGAGVVPIIGLPTGAGPEGMSHMPPWEKCVLRRNPKGVRTRHYN